MRIQAPVLFSWHEELLKSCYRALRTQTLQLERGEPDSIIVEHSFQLPVTTHSRQGETVIMGTSFQTKLFQSALNWWGKAKQELPLQIKQMPAWERPPNKKMFWLEAISVSISQHFLLDEPWEMGLSHITHLLHLVKQWLACQELTVG